VDRFYVHVLISLAGGYVKVGANCITDYKSSQKQNATSTSEDKMDSRPTARVLLAVFVGLLQTIAAVSAYGTAIIAVRYPNGIVIFADSKPTYFPPSQLNAVCKIVPARNAYLAVAGLVRDPSRHFDVEEIAANAFNSTASFRVHVANALGEIERKGKKEINRVRSEDIAQYRFMMKNDGNVIDIVFVAFENEVPMLSARRLHWSELTSELEISQEQNCPGVDCPDGNYVSQIGKVSEIQKYIALNRSSVLDEPTISNLMTLQTKATPEDVGLPIEVLSLDSSGPTWHANPLGCPLRRSTP
jgi:hypothetical protein